MKTYRVYNTQQGADENHGEYDSLDQARGCVEFDGLKYYEIWYGDELVEQHCQHWNDGK